jgi:hypothetical protein
LENSLTSSVLSRCETGANCAAAIQLSLGMAARMREAFIAHIAPVTPHMIRNVVAEKALGLPRSY